jgi:hypothetical protein
VAARISQIIERSDAAIQEKDGVVTENPIRAEMA